jgi:hypothetical protein
MVMMAKKKKQAKKSRPLSMARTNRAMPTRASAPHLGRSTQPSGPWAPLSRPAAFIALLVVAALLLWAVSRPAPEKVKVDYLFANSCDYCTAAQPRVEAAVAQMNGQVSLTYWNGDNRQTDPATSDLYADYKVRGLFGGFPTLVAHGVKGDTALIGLVSQEEVHGWLCRQFVYPPSGC